nr:DUF6037 family protein [Bacillus nakamurai]
MHYLFSLATCGSDSASTDKDKDKTTQQEEKDTKKTKTNQKTENQSNNKSVNDKKEKTENTSKKDASDKKASDKKKLVDVTLNTTVDGDTIKVNYKGEVKTVRYLLVNSRVEIHEIAELNPTYEDSEKIYFKGWRDNNIRGKKVRNLQKTRECLGEEAYQICKAYNISSAWTKHKTESKEFYLPDV